MKNYLKLATIAIAIIMPSLAFAQAGARYRVAKEIYDNPSILTEPGFWIVIGVIVVCVIIYGLVKDKDK